MSMELAFWLIFGATAVIAVSLLVLAIARGPVRPERTWPWLLAVIIMVAGALLNGAVLIGGLLNNAAGIAWMLPATVALLAATAMMFVRPRWAAWTLAVTALAVPALVFLATLVVGNPEQGQDLLPAMLIFYSVRSLVAAGLLWLADRPRGVRPPASPSPAQRSESVLTG